jgi:hypothetical protein
MFVGHVAQQPDALKAEIKNRLLTDAAASATPPRRPTTK